jgi:broad specificity phosphatase PhoE
MPIAFLITHPDVAIDETIRVPDWPLNQRGRARMRSMLCRPWIRSVRSVFSSNERKARDGAEILAEGLGLSKYTVVMGLGENDRSATGFLVKAEFEAAVDAFFAQPHTSVRGWETAADAQARIVGAVEQVLSQAPDEHDVAMIGHGGTGTLLYCHLAGVPISRQYDQPATNGGNWFGCDRANRHLLHAGWQPIDAMA